MSWGRDQPGLRLAGKFWSDAPLGSAPVVVAADAGPIESPWHIGHGVAVE
jgi:hypothetical protein